MPISSLMEMTPIAEALSATYTTARLTTKSTSKKRCRITAIHTTAIGTIASETRTPLSHNGR